MPMLTLREFTYEELKTKLTPHDRILVVSCDSCARMSDGLGGQGGLDSLAAKLEADGFIVVKSLMAKGCHANFLEEQLEDPAFRAAVEASDVVIPLMCVSGEKTVAGVLPAVDVLHVAASVGKGPGADGSSGARLTRAFGSAGVDVNETHAMGLDEVARKTGRHNGPF